MILYPFGKGEADSEVVEQVESRISGTFRGWTGRTEFTLVNGQVWRQTSFECLYRYAFMPRVIIYGTSGGHRMRVEGVPSTVPVTRLR